MKKVLKSLLLVLSIMLVGCGKEKKEENPKEPEESVFKMDDLVDYVVDLSDASALGIAKEVPSQSTLLSNSLLSENKKNHYFVKQKCDGNDCHLEKVNFIKGEDVVRQDDLDYQVNRLYVGRDFTFIQFARVCNIEEGCNGDFRNYYEIDEWGRHDLSIMDTGYASYDISGYYDDENHKTFIIDNDTGKIYALSNSINYFSIEGNLLVNNALSETPIVYDIYVNEEGNLVFENIFNNPNVNLISVYKDKFSNIYIRNNSISNYDEERNINYYIGDKYFFDFSNHDSYVLKSSSIFIEEDSSCSFINNVPNGDITFVGANFSEVKIEEDYIGIYQSNINNKCNQVIRYTHDKSLWTSFYNNGSASIDKNSFRSYIKSDGEFILLEEIFDNSNMISVNQLLNNKYVIYVEDNRLKYFDVTSPIANQNLESGYMYKKFFLVDQVTYLYDPDDSLAVDKKNMYSKNSPTGSIIFTIVLGDDGIPEVLEISDNNYKKNDVILQPLN